jgi:Tfp pilus assembly protein PilO
MKPISDIISPLYERYDQETKTYYTHRDSGLYSVLIWTIRKIILLELNGYPVENITILLQSYLVNVCAYTLLFDKKDIQLDFSNVSDEDKKFFEEKMITSGWGLGDNVKDLNFELTNQVINKFFTPTQKVIDMYNSLLSTNNIDLNNTIFVWARDTDKSETHLPSVEEYLKVVNSIDKTGKEIVLQTDDYRVLENFKNSGEPIKVIKEIPISNSLDGFHNEMSRIYDEKFEKEFGINKEEYVLQMYCLSLFCKNAYKSILYPGNPTTYIPILKGSFDNCYLFKNNIQLF